MATTPPIVDQKTYDATPKTPLLDKLKKRYDEEQLGVNWGNSLQGTEAAQQSVYTNFMQLMGRPPTESELSEYSLTGGGAAGITAAVSALKHTPAEDLRRSNEKLLTDAPKHYDKIKGQFQSILGRDPTQEELDHFGSVMASGATDAYGLQDFLKNLPENVTKQDKAFRDSFNTEAQGYDARYYKEQILPAIESRFLTTGRSLDSSGVSQAMAQAASQQNRQRESFLANLSAQQYGGNQANAYAQYANNMGNYQNTMYQSALAPYNKLSELSDYKVQQDAYASYLQRYGKRSAGQNAMAGAAAGGTAGAMTGNPYIALGGAVAGGIGGYYSS